MKLIIRTGFVVYLVLALFLISTADAKLIDNNDGTVTQIRNDGSILMWLKDANYAFTSGYDADGWLTWAEANTWIDYLNTNNHLGYNDWRLPTTQQPDPTCSDQSFGSYGSNCSGSEMGHLYYIEGVTYSNQGFFNNIQVGSWYWTSTDYIVEPDQHAWEFNLDWGTQGGGNKSGWDRVLPVRVVPEPISSALFIVGGATLGLRRFCRR